MHAHPSPDVSFGLDLADLAATEALAARLAALARPGDVIGLSGDLGAGKTAFARAFIRARAAAAGSAEDAREVPSPTFTLVQLYEFANGAIYHFDLYRIADSDELFEIGIDDALSAGISLIEWPDRMGALLPGDRIDVVLGPGQSQTARAVTVTGHGSWMDRLSAAFGAGGIGALGAADG